ncbi:MAG: protoporphyrinogen oxidase [Planctomycetaceae bacterium]|nr:protoporphyrinogen oxidase [Planctomycetaceae bacterium]
MSEPAIQEPYRVAVVGGGLSGLSAAHRVIELSKADGRTLDLTLFEATPRTGGMIATKRIGDYLVELGADSFITNKPAGVELCRRLGIEDELIPTEDAWRKSLVLRNGKPVEVPEGFMLLSPAKVWPILKSPLFSWAGKLRMGWERFLPAKKTSTDDESLASFVRRRFGQELLDRLVQPLVGGIYTSDPEKLSLRATLPRFLEQEQEYGSLIKASRAQASKRSAAEMSGSGARYGLFTAPKHGIQTILDALREQVKASATIRSNCPIVSIERSDDNWVLTTANGESENFDAVILALPTHKAAELVQSVSADLAEDLHGIEYASSAIVVSGHKLSDIDHPLDAFGLVIPEIEHRDVIAVSFSSRKFPGRAPDGKVVLRTFVGGAMHSEKMELTDDEMKKVVRRELGDMLGVSGEPDFEEVVRYENSMPQYHVGHLERVASIESQVAELPGLELAGNAYRGVGIPDSIASGEAAAERILK